MKDERKICLSCKHFRLERRESGLCRVEKDRAKNYPNKRPDEECLKWQNCGQQYFIRLGWLKAQAKAAEEAAAKVD